VAKEVAPELADVFVELTVVVLLSLAGVEVIVVAVVVVVVAAVVVVAVVVVVAAVVSANPPVSFTGAVFDSTIAMVATADCTASTPDGVSTWSVDSSSRFLSRGDPVVMFVVVVCMSSASNSMSSFAMMLVVFVDVCCFGASEEESEESEDVVKSIFGIFFTKPNP
jgi:hypothetical protein